jgi:hypothetical protein
VFTHGDYGDFDYKNFVVSIIVVRHTLLVAKMSIDWLSGDSALSHHVAWVQIHHEDSYLQTP